MKKGTTIYLYELAWILPSIAIPVGMLAALTVTAFGAGIHLPSVAGRADSTTLATTAPFDKPGLTQVSPDHYVVYLTGQVWAFAPNEIRVPVGSTVTFMATSRDVVHGLMVHGANVNTMLLPGQIALVTTRFDRPGSYPMICHEYCGIAHHTMSGTIVVEPRS